MLHYIFLKMNFRLSLLKHLKSQSFIAQRQLYSFKLCVVIVGRGVANFGEIFEKSEIGVQIFFFYVGIFFPLPGGEKTVFYGISEPIPRCGGDIRKNGQTFSDLNFHKI